VISAMVEASLFQQIKTYTKMKIDEHVYLTALRIYVYCICFQPHFKLAIVYLIPSLLMFSFVHNSIYYETRKYLSNGKVYPEGYKSTSTTTDAKISFNFKTRSLLFIGGLILITLINYFYQ
jgi:hypothetical protein